MRKSKIEERTWKTCTHYGEHWDGAIMLKICKMWLGCISKHSLADLAC